MPIGRGNWLIYDDLAFTNTKSTELHSIGIARALVCFLFNLCWVVVWARADSLVAETQVISLCSLWTKSAMALVAHFHFLNIIRSNLVHSILSAINFVYLYHANAYCIKLRHKQFKILILVSVPILFKSKVFFFQILMFISSWLYQNWRFNHYCS